MTPVSLDKMRAQLCPRISARDVLALAETRIKSFVLIDIRPATEFADGYLKDSKNMPYEQLDLAKLFKIGSANSPSDADPTLNLVFVLTQHKNSIKIIVSSDELFDSAVDLANRLVRLKHTQVCLLHKGIDILKPTELYLAKN
jgi:rhodanese-related sulfurtransferase